MVKSPNYTFTDEDPSVYSDLEEPHTSFHYEAFPEEAKNLPVIRTRIGYDRFELSRPSVDPPQHRQTLSKIATLVQKEQALLQEAGVVPAPVPPERSGQQQPDPVPGSSREEPSRPTVSTRAREHGAIPKKKLPSLKEGDTKCPVCKKDFNQFSRLEGHYATKHAYQGKYYCDVCYTAFSSQMALDQHALTHAKFKCHLHHTGVGTVCSKFYDSLDLLLPHLQQDPSYAVVPQDQRCPHCLKPFTGKTPHDNLKKHVKYRCTHNPGMQLEYFFCKFCNKRIPERKYLKDHEKDCKVGQSSRGVRGRGKGRGRGRGKH